MGKFNSSDGYNFKRSVKDILGDYARFLLKNSVINDQEFNYYLSEGKDELLDILFEKIYETEIINGVEVDTLDSFFHFCNFIIGTYNGQRVWNVFVKEMFLSIERNKNTCIMASR